MKSRAVYALVVASVVPTTIWGCVSRTPARAAPTDAQACATSQEPPTTPVHASGAPDSLEAPHEHTVARPPWARQRADLEHRIEVAQLLLAKAQIEVEQGELKHRDRLAQTEMEFELAKRRQQISTKFTTPNRIARAELSLQQTEEGVLEARAELDELLRKSGDPPAASGTAQTLTERAQRRLERAQRDLELRREELRILKEVTLPLEQMELDLAAEQKKRAVLQAQRDDEGPLIDRRIAVLNAQAELARLEAALADLPTEADKEAAGAASRPAPQPDPASS
jgi:hypothetical protein